MLKQQKYHLIILLLILGCLLAACGKTEIPTTATQVTKQPPLTSTATAVSHGAAHRHECPAFA